MEWHPIGFVNNLKYMGLGLLGTFLIIGLIIGATVLCNYGFNKLSEKMAAKKAAEEKNEQ